ncbi:MAG: hypothetical protein AUI15_35140 [Actinobacteria bacterium 13_2_20CM_2_66_6]|nr:MAG: hypothetical protein AUI15_35140 [Actinobacteria bacterium 13_2_20CM_2_66_6]
MARRRLRHRGQAGTTLVELVVSVVIIGLAVTLLVGAFSTGVIQSSLVKKTTSADSAMEFELERIAAATYDSTPQPYSECFAVDGPMAPAFASAYQGSCPAGTGLRADVTESDVQPGLQQWSVGFVTYPALGAVASPISVYKSQR